MIQSKKTGIERIVGALWFSIEGLRSAFISEAAFRQELLLFVIALPLAFVLSISPVERALMVSSLLIVLIAELINSAIEAAVERISSEWHELSKKAKDLGSAAVFLSLVNAFFVWAVIIADHIGIAENIRF